MDVPPYSSQSIHLALACYVLIFPWVFDVWEIVLWNSRIFWFYFSKPACCSVSLSLSFIESSNSSSNMCESGSSANLSKSLHCLLKKKTIFFQTFSFCLVCATTFVSSLTGWMVSIFSLSFPFFWRMFESGEEFHKISTDFWRASLDLLQFTPVLLEGNPNVKWCFCLWKFAIIW